MTSSAKKVLVTGAGGFVGSNLTVRLRELGHEVLEFRRGDSVARLQQLVSRCDAVVHLAGENRPADVQSFERVNAELTRELCELIRQTGRALPLVLSSSAQAGNGSPYGLSKLAAEDAVRQLHESSGAPVTVFRFPGIFGKWCRPNYNSVVATFCHQIANGLPVRVDDAEKLIDLVYIDDAVDSIVQSLDEASGSFSFKAVQPQYSIGLGALKEAIESFSRCPQSLMVGRVGVGLTRALYSTYLSYLPTERFAHGLEKHSDARGDFVEMLKTPDSGQFSYFTAHPGVTRGGHYHHTKTEKFLVIKGTARFGFRNIRTNELHELTVSGSSPTVVETIPGWTHDIKNVGSDELVVMLWANEVFDRARPDTFASKVSIDE